MSAKFDVGDAVEAKATRGLGGWSPATVEKVVSHGNGRTSYYVRIGSRSVEVNASYIRAPRERSTPTVAPRAPRSPRKRRETQEGGRGPLRYDDFRKWVKSRPCIFCEMKAEDPHHYGPKGTGQTTDDTRIVPVCRKAHDALHARRPDELCAPTAYIRDDPHHAWAVIEAHIFRWQVNLLTEFLRYHGGEMR